MTKINRRDFLKAIGLGSTATAAACSADPISWDPMVPIEHAYPYVAQPEQIEPGNASYITSICNQCSEGCGILAKNREGRVLNVEGNPKHPLSQGNICFRGQTGLQETYSPDRLSGPTKAGASVSWDDALKEIASASSGNVTWIGRPRSGASGALVKQFVKEALNGNILYWDELDNSALRLASQKVFGINGIPTFKLDDAHTIVSFGTDFMNAEGSVSLANGWSKAKDPKHGDFVTKMFTVGPRMSLTSTNGDIHISSKAGTEVLVALAAAKKLAAKNGYNGSAKSLLASIDADKLIGDAGAKTELVDMLVEAMNGHSSVALPGGIEASNGDELAIATLLLNEVAGNLGTSVQYGAHSENEFSATAKQVLEAVQGAKGGTLFVDGLDLGYVFSSKSGMQQALAGVKNFVVFSNELNDGVTDGALVVPVGTGLEKWSDSESRIGLHSISQAAMKPVNDNVIMSAEDIILKVSANKGLKAVVVAPIPTEDPVDEVIENEVVATENTAEDGTETSPQPAISSAPVPGLDAGDFFSYLKSWWEAIVYPKYKSNGGDLLFRQFWMNTLKSGVFQAKVASIKPTWLLSSLAAPKVVTFEGSGDLDLVLFPHPYTGMGRHSNRPWAREIPDPLTNFTWGTWIEVHPTTAESLGLKKNKGATLKTANGEINVGWYGIPGVRPGTVALVVGGGKSKSGRYAELGANPISIINHAFDASGNLAFSTTKASVSANDERNAASHQNDLVKSDTLSKNDRNVNFTTSMVDYKDAALVGAGSVVPEHHLPETSMAMRSRKTDNRFHVEGKDTTPKLTDMYPEPEHPTYRFGMTIDLNKCNGCNACAAACYAENNVAVVGPEQVRLGRNMGWIRMSRYWEGSDVQESGKADVRFQPVMCQHCSHAPCEGVCPVLATYHNLDGLNAMIYNRCVGTRYCANNCPYSARRFNFHSYRWPESFNLMLNPNVLVREMGVMEKCTFCVQRIREFKDEWRDSRDFKQGTASTGDYSRITACASACPSDAITFGNLNDEKSEVSQQFEDRRAFKMLNELNTKPGVAYLTRIVHADETFLHHGGHGAGHGSAHGAEHGSAHGAGHGDHGDGHDNSHDDHGAKDNHGH